jgi:hypothetical protein
MILVDARDIAHIDQGVTLKVGGEHRPGAKRA